MPQKTPHEKAHGKAKTKKPEPEVKPRVPKEEISELPDPEVPEISDDGVSRRNVPEVGERPVPSDDDIERGPNQEGIVGGDVERGP